MARNNNYLNRWMNQPTPQNEALSGQSQNNAGGYSYTIDSWKQLNRFLVLGTESGTYYVGQRKLTTDNVTSVRQCLQEDPYKTVDISVSISTGGRAPSNDEAIFALAMAASVPEVGARNYALSKLSAVCRTATHLFDFLTHIQLMRGWGRSLRSHVAAWYTEKDPDKLAYQLVKYRQRNGWTHRDVLRKAHPKAQNATMNNLLQWVTQPDSVDFSKWDYKSEASAMIAAYEFANSGEATQTDLVRLITDINLPREALPTEVLTDPVIWKAMLDNKMPMTAMIRNLRNMDNYGVFNDTRYVDIVCEALESRDNLQYARIHPVAILKAMFSYSGNRAIGDALESAFYTSFDFVDPTNKRWNLGIDVSGSMTMGNIAGIPGFTPNIASATMAMVTARSERHYDINGFAGQFVPLPITRNTRLNEAMRITQDRSFGRTDCAQPMLEALSSGKGYDVFVIYTDSETWHGRIHPAEALRDYNSKMGLNAKLIVVGMVANNFSIADPSDANMLDVVGFDTQVPQIMAEFVR